MFKNRIVSVAVASLMLGGLGVGAANAATTADQPAQPNATVSAGSMGFTVKSGDPVINEVLLSWNFNDKAYWGYKLEADKPVFEDASGKATTVKQVSWMTLKERLVLMKEGEVINFTLTDNYSGQKSTVKFTVPTDRKAFGGKVSVVGNQATLTWEDLGDAPQDWLVDGDRGNLAEYAILAKVAGGQGAKSITFKDLKYGQTTEFRIHNPYTLKTQVLKAYVKPINKQGKATRVVKETPKPILVDKRGLENDLAEAPKATDDVISYMDWNPYNGDWKMTSYTRDPNSTFANGKKWMVQSGKLVK